LPSGSALYTHVAAFKNSSNNPIWVSIEDVRNAALSNSNVDSVLLGGNNSADVLRFSQNMSIRLATNSSGSGSINVAGFYELEQAGLNTNTFNMTVDLDKNAGGMFLRNTDESINDAYNNRTSETLYYSSTTDKLLAIFSADAAPSYVYGRHSDRVLVKANGSVVTTQLIGEISVSDIANILDVQVNQYHNIYMPDGSGGWTEITQASQLATAPNELRIGTSSADNDSIEISNRYQNGDLYDFKDDVSNIQITGFTSYYKESGSDRWFDRSSDVQVTEVGPTSGTDESSWVFPDPNYKALYMDRLKEQEYQNYPSRQDMIKFDINKVVDGSENVHLGTFVCKNESTSNKCNLVEVAEQLANVMASGYPTTEMPGYESTSSDKVEAPLRFTENVSDDVDQDAIINRLQEFVKESLSDLSSALSDDATSIVTDINNQHIVPSKTNIENMLSSTASGNEPSIYKLLKTSNDRVEQVSSSVNHIKRDGIATSDSNSGIIDNDNLPTYSNIKNSIADIRNDTKTSVIHLESINDLKKEIERRLADVTALINYHKNKSEEDGKERIDTKTSELITIAKGFVTKYEALNTELSERNTTINTAVDELATMANRINQKARLAQYAVQEVATIADIPLSQTLIPYRPDSIEEETLQNQTQAVVNETIPQSS
jgi:predicted RecB family endonuclease